MIDKLEYLADKSSIREWASLFSGKYFVMIAVYADETGTGGVPQNGKEPAPGVYAYLATPEVWESFRLEWKAALGKNNVEYFHFRQLNKSERKKVGNPYNGWSDESVDDFIYDMATVASCGPIPFGGNASVKMRFGKNPTSAQLNKIYKSVFYWFFSDLKVTMNDHFPEETGKVSLFFSDIDNEEWIAILNQVIKDARNHDSRLGEYSFIDYKDYRGMPCQAADLFAYVNRQNMSSIYDAGYNRPLRILDIIVGRHAFPKDHPGYELRTMPDAEWRKLISEMRSEKRDIEVSHHILGEPKPEYFPTLVHPYFRDLFSSPKHYEFIKKHNERLRI